MRSAVGRAAGVGSWRPRSTASGGTISSGRPAAGSSPVTRAMATVSSTSLRRASAELAGKYPEADLLKIYTAAL